MTTQITQITLNDVDLKKVQKVAKEFNNDINAINRQIRTIQSIKCRLKKQKFRKDYEVQMTRVLKNEQILKEARNLMKPKNIPVTQFNSEDIEKLNYNETIAAIRSIQSKKSLTKYLTIQPGESSEYLKACEIENNLKIHKSKISPKVKKNVTSKKLLNVVETIESSGDLEKEEIIRLLKELM